MTTLLAIIVAVAVIGQLALILWLRSRDTHNLSKVKIARLLEDAADRQAVAAQTHTAKLSENTKGPLGD